MAKELIISSNRHETKVALFEDEQLVEMYFQRADEYSLAGSIHKGRVTRVLPGMQSAFVNIGLERDAFLYVSDFFEESEEDFDKVPVSMKPKSRSPQAVDEDTGEPSDESNERFATAQTVASLAVEQESTEEVEPSAPASSSGVPRSAADSGQRPAYGDRGAGYAESPDDRRGRRRRRRRGRGGAGLPESKFAEGGGGARAPRREDDEDSRWNRVSPTAKGGGAVDDEDPPQSVMIAKVSDPNRLPPSRHSREEHAAGVLPGESLAKYRRSRGSEPRPDPSERKDTAELSQGGRYSQPRRSRHGSRAAGFLAKSDDDSPASGGSEELEDGTFAALYAPDSPKIYLAVEADDEASDAASADAASGEKPKKAARKATKKKAVKATKSAGTAAKKRAKKSTAKAAKGEDTPEAEEIPSEEAVVETQDAPVAGQAAEAIAESKPEVRKSTRSSRRAKAAAKKPTGRTASEEGAETEAEDADVEAIEFVAASAMLPDIEESEADMPMEVDLDKPADDGDEAESDEDGDEGEVAAPRAGSEDETSPRLSRRERRRLRMIEKREERKRDRGARRQEGVTAAATVAPVVETEEAPARETVEAEKHEREPRGRDRDRGERSDRAVRTERPERSDRPERAERSDRPERTERPERSDRPDRAERSDRAEKPDRGDRTERTDRSDRSRGKNTQVAPLISEVLKEGQEVLVQIAKEPLGQKGARITSHIALPGRYVVYMPTVEHVGVSRKVGTDQERLRLRKILQSARDGMPGGFICRTAAEGRSEPDIRADMEFLHNLWQDIRSKADKKNPPALVHHDLDIVQRVLRDQLTEEFKTIWVDSEELYERILRFVQSFQPSLVSRVRLYTKPAPIFDTFNVTAELEKALRPKVWLKSGGYIVINQTEALVAIDVNTGKFVGKSNRLEDTIVKTNLEAVKEAVRQIRLRDLGGIIVVDFIDMDERRNRQKVMQALDEAMKEDRAPYKILQFNDFGLVAITRKRVKQSLERTLCQHCPYCEGAGYIKNVQTVIGEILTEAQKIAKAVEGEVSLRVNPEVGKVLKSHTNHYLEELEEILKVPVIVTSDALLHQEKFDLA